MDIKDYLVLRQENAENATLNAGNNKLTCAQCTLQCNLMGAMLQQNTYF